MRSGKSKTALDENVKMTKNGVFLLQGDQKKKIAPRLEFTSIGTRLLDGTKVGRLVFEDFDRKKCLETVPLSLLTAGDHRELVTKLADRGYIWPRCASAGAIIAQLVERLPSGRFQLVPAPGWYAESY